VRVKRGAKVLAAGHRWREGEAELEVLWPKAGELTDDWNTNSIVLLLRVRSFSLLLMADANHRTERALGTLSPVTVLRVGHHGAADATSPQFLEAISPKVAIISVNKDNVRGYPDPKVVERLRAGGRTVFRTDEDGTVVLTIERDGSYRVQTDDHGNQRQTGASSRSQQLSTTPERPRKEGEHDGH
jgi:competence protein ComEC